jgi:hypothetical protein
MCGSHAPAVSVGGLQMRGVLTAGLTWIAVYALAQVSFTANVQ